MYRFFRTLLYTTLLLGALGFLTYSVYYAPGQVLVRVSKTLEHYLSVPPQVAGARQGWLSPLRIHRIGIPAGPQILAKDLLILQEIQVEGLERTGLPGRVLGSSPGSDGVSVQVGRAELGLDLRMEEGGAAGESSRNSWNFQSALKEDRFLERTARQILQAGHRIAVKSLLVRLQEMRKTERAAWEALIEDLTLEGLGGDALEVRGAVLPSSLQQERLWNEGQFRLVYRPDPSAEQPTLEAQGTLDGVQNADAWLALFFPPHRLFVSMVRPSGPATFNLGSLRYFPGRPAGALDIRADIRHYDSILRIPPWNFEVRQVSGSLAVDPSLIAFGAVEGGKGKVSGEVWGTEVELSGRIAKDGALLKVRLPAWNLQAASVSAFPTDLAKVWSRWRPSGRAEGELAIRFVEERLSDWSAAVSFHGLAAEGLSAFGPLQGKVTLRETRGQNGGVLEIDTGRLDPLGDLKGSVPFSWTASSLVLKPAGLRVGKGSLFGEVEFHPHERTLGMSLRLDGASLSLGDGLLSASGANGRIGIQAGPSALTGQGQFDLAEISLRQDLLPMPESPRKDVAFPGSAPVPPAAPPPAGAQLSFKDGQVLFSVNQQSSVTVDLAFRAPECGLRLQGTIGGRGSLVAVAVLAQGEPARALNLLRTGSSPAEWKRATESQALPLRVSGEALHPRLRIAEWTDGVFAPAESPAPAPAASPPAPETPGTERRS